MLFYFRPDPALAAGPTTSLVLAHARALSSDRKHRRLEAGGVATQLCCMRTKQVQHYELRCAAVLLEVPTARAGSVFQRSSERYTRYCGVVWCGAVQCGAMVVRCAAHLFQSLTNFSNSSWDSVEVRSSKNFFFFWSSHTLNSVARAK